jgi:hypothetical protein
VAKRAREESQGKGRLRKEGKEIVAKRGRLRNSG